jgi:hypothetical protein
MYTDEIDLEDEKSSNLVSFLKYFDIEQKLVNRLGEVLKTIGRNILLRLDQYDICLPFYTVSLCG